MEETVKKIDLFKKRDELGIKISKIIDDRKLTTDEEIESLDEHKEFIKIENELKALF